MGEPLVSFKQTKVSFHKTANAAADEGARMQALGYHVPIAGPAALLDLVTGDPAKDGPADPAVTTWHVVVATNSELATVGVSHD